MQQYASLTSRLSPHALDAVARSQLAARGRIMQTVLNSARNELGSGMRVRAYEQLVADVGSVCDSTGPCVPASTKVAEALMQLIDVQREFMAQGPSSMVPPRAWQLLSWLQFVTLGLSTLSHTRDAVCEPQPHTDAGDTDSAAPRMPVRRHDMLHLIPRVVSSVRAFSIEKFGVAPCVRVCMRGGAEAQPGALNRDPAFQPTFVGNGAYLSFILSELLKNSFRACVDAATPAGVEDASPVAVAAWRAGDRAFMAVQDHGAGMASAPAGPCALGEVYFASTSSTRSEATYQYSRDFGAAFTGYGIGLVRCKVLARTLGGRMHYFNMPANGMLSLCEVDASGATAFDWEPPPP